MTPPGLNVQLDVALIVALLFGAGIYLILSRNLLRILFGFLLLSNGANLVLLAVSGDPTGRVAPVVRDAGVTAARATDPLPQALILTAIVIGFGVAAYLVFVLYRMFAEKRAVTLEDIFSEPPDPTSAAAEENDFQARRASGEDRLPVRGDPAGGAGEGHG